MRPECASGGLRAREVRDSRSVDTARPAMKRLSRSRLQRSWYTDEQIAYALRQADSGRACGDVC